MNPLKGKNKGSLTKFKKKYSWKRSLSLGFKLTRANLRAGTNEELGFTERPFSPQCEGVCVGVGAGGDAWAIQLCDQIRPFIQNSRGSLSL